MIRVPFTSKTELFSDRCDLWNNLGADCISVVFCTIGVNVFRTNDPHKEYDGFGKEPN